MIVTNKPEFVIEANYLPEFSQVQNYNLEYSLIGIRFNRQTERQCLPSDDLTFQRQILYLPQIVHVTSNTICLGVAVN